MSESLNFDHIPGLPELLPKFRGLPGVSYHQVCAENFKRAQDQGLHQVEGSFAYTIEGPDGSADMILFCDGAPIRGLAPQSSKRRMFVDELVELKTGIKLDNESEPEVEDDPPAKGRKAAA